MRSTSSPVSALRDRVRSREQVSTTSPVSGGSQRHTPAPRAQPIARALRPEQGQRHRGDLRPRPRHGAPLQPQPFLLALRGACATTQRRVARQPPGARAKLEVPLGSLSDEPSRTCASTRSSSSPAPPPASAPSWRGARGAAATTSSLVARRRDRLEALAGELGAAASTVRRDARRPGRPAARASAARRAAQQRTDRRRAVQQRRLRHLRALWELDPRARGRAGHAQRRRPARPDARLLPAMVAARRRLDPQHRLDRRRPAAARQRHLRGDQGLRQLASPRRCTPSSGHGRLVHLVAARAGAHRVHRRSPGRRHRGPCARLRLGRRPRRSPARPSTGWPRAGARRPRAGPQGLASRRAPDAAPVLLPAAAGAPALPRPGLSRRRRTAPPPRGRSRRPLRRAGAGTAGRGGRRAARRAPTSRRCRRA